MTAPYSCTCSASARSPLRCPPACTPHARPDAQDPAVHTLPPLALYPEFPPSSPATSPYTSPPRCPASHPEIADTSPDPGFAHIAAGTSAAPLRIPLPWPHDSASLAR